MRTRILKSRTNLLPRSINNRNFPLAAQGRRVYFKWTEVPRLMIKFDLNNKTRAAGAGYAIMAGVYVTAAFFGQALLSALKVTGAAYYAVAPVFSAIALIVATAFSVRAYGAGVKIVCGYRKFPPVYIIVAVLAAFGMFAGLGFVNDLFARALQKIGVNVPQSGIEINSAWEFALLIVALAALPAVTEESFFRGAIGYGVSSCGALTGAAVTAACFALYHGSLSQLLYQFAYGAALYVLAKKSGSTFPGMIAHFLNNAAVLCLAYFNAEVNLYSLVSIACGIAALAAAGAVLFFYGRKKSGAETPEEKKEDGEHEEGKIRDFFLPYGILGAAIFVALIVGSAAV